MGLFTPGYVRKKAESDMIFEQFLQSQNFVISKKVYQYPSIYVDDSHKKFALSDRERIFHFSDLLDYGNEQITSFATDKPKGAAGKALIGGLAFGVTGAVVGASMKKDAIQRSITTSETHIILNDLSNPRITFNYYVRCMYMDGKKINSLAQKIDEVEGAFGYIKAKAAE